MIATLGRAPPWSRGGPPRPPPPPPPPVVAAVAAARPRPPDLYIVTDVDIPFVQDGTRDGEHARSWMHGRFLEELRARALPHIVVSGPREERLRAAAAAIDARVLAPRGYVRV